MEKTLCAECQKSTKKFTVTKDWEGRQYHKKCYKQLQQKKEAIEFMKRMDCKFGTNMYNNYLAAPQKSLL
jgi:hypothetical protein